MCRLFLSLSWSHSLSTHFHWVTFRAFTSNWITCFGVQVQITTDHDWQFEATLSRELSWILGFLHIQTTSYQLASNGIVEHFHRQLKSAVHTTANPQSWTEFLPIVLLGCCTAVNSDLGYSSAELLNGIVLSLPGAIVGPTKPSCTNPVLCVARLRTISSYILADIDYWTHVFVWGDSVQGPLVNPIKDPFVSLLICQKFLKWISMVRLRLCQLTSFKKYFMCVTHLLLTFQSHLPLIPFNPLDIHIHRQLLIHIHKHSWHLNHLYLYFHRYTLTNLMSLEQTEQFTDPKYYSEEFTFDTSALLWSLARHFLSCMVDNFSFQQL